jgi:hypothetical protein
VLKRYPTACRLDIGVCRRLCARASLGLTGLVPPRTVRRSPSATMASVVPPAAVRLTEAVTVYLSFVIRIGRLTLEDVGVLP